MDPPEHTPYRNLIEPYFAEQAMNKFETVGDLGTISSSVSMLLGYLSEHPELRQAPAPRSVKQCQMSRLTNRFLFLESELPESRHGRAPFVSAE